MYKQLQSASEADGKFFTIHESKKKSLKKIYIVGPYGGRIMYFKPLLSNLRKKGYQTTFIQPCKRVLSVGNLTNLKLALKEINLFISRDRQKYGSEATALIGVSLGSYLGLNVAARKHVDCLVAIAGGSRLVDVFNDNRMFKRARNQLLQISYPEKVKEFWGDFDQLHTKVSLNNLKVLLINSKNDSVIKSDNLLNTVRELEESGAKVTNYQTGYLPHILQALSVNFRTNQIVRFIEHQK